MHNRHLEDTWGEHHVDGWGGGGHKEDQSHAVSAERELWSLPVSAMSRGSHLCHDSCYLRYILSSYGVKAICMDVTSKTTQWAHSGWLLSSERVCSLEDCHVQILSANASWLTGAHGAIERTRWTKNHVNECRWSCILTFASAILEEQLKCFLTFCKNMSLQAGSHPNKIVMGLSYTFTCDSLLLFFTYCMGYVYM